MRQRCSDPNCPEYHNYGGRGISVCPRWESFINFAADMGPRPVGTSLDRRENNGDYEPGNCRWATVKQQHRNKRTNRPITHEGRTLLLCEWAEFYGLRLALISQRLSRGWTVAEALTTPRKDI